MLIVVSPAKKLDWDVPPGPVTRPRLQDQANILVERGQALSVNEVKSLMRLSDNLARLTWERFHAMTPEPDASARRPALRAFAGDTFRGLDAATLDAAALDYAEDHLRILSGLYGILRPRDAIQPYRLEMGTRLQTCRGKNLYDFWSDRIATALNEDARVAGTGILVNCASQEYAAAIDRRCLELKVITPRFFDMVRGVPKVVGIRAKQARGAMARFLCENRATDPDFIPSFDGGGYVFSPDLSEPDAPAFVRGES